MLTRRYRLVACLFQRLREKAPCILFFDEVDSLFARPGPSDNYSHDMIAGVKSAWGDLINEKCKVFVYGATNQPWKLTADTGMARRFQRKVFLGLPSKRVILDLLKTFFAKKPNALQEGDLDWVADRLLGGAHSNVMSFLRLIIQDQALEALDAGNWEEVRDIFCHFL